MVSNDSTRNISPKPEISLSSNGLTASGVPSLPVTPVPPVVSMTSGLGSEIQGDTDGPDSVFVIRDNGFFMDTVTC